MTEAKCSLYCTEGSSDKVYQVTLQARGAGWVVEFAYGRRGQALKTGTKTATPVDSVLARQIYDKLVKEKTSKGYTPDQSGVAYTNTEYGARASGFSPQLPIAIDGDDAWERYIKDPAWGMQEKCDGENRTLQIADCTVRGINRKGLYVDIPQAWASDYGVLGSILICGEHTRGDMFHAFDLIECEGEDLRELTYEARYLRLMKLVNAAPRQPASLRVVPLVVTSDGKRAHRQSIREANGEGVVYKRLDANFEAGRSTAAIKDKFVESATCIVLKQNPQRSVVVGLLDDTGRVLDLGSVSIPADHAVPAIDDLVEVRYLYRYEEGCFEQPVYLGIRSDLDRSDATLAQVKRIKPKATQAA